MCILVPMCNINYKNVVNYVVTRIPYFSIKVSQCTVHTMCFTEIYNIYATKNSTLGKPNTSENRTIGAVRQVFGLDRFDCILKIRLTESWLSLCELIISFDYDFVFPCSITLSWYTLHVIISTMLHILSLKLHNTVFYKSYNAFSTKTYLSSIICF